MSSLIIFCRTLLLIKLSVFWRAVRTGKRLNQREALKEQVDIVANVNKFNRREYKALNHQILQVIVS